MSVTHFDRDKKARWYARRHLETDPGTRIIYYLPREAPDREIRFLEVNESIAARDLAPLEPIDFGVDTDSPDAHTLLVLDVTPAQWEKISRGKLRLPDGWSLKDFVPFSRKNT